jgi:uncharacterized protein
MEDRMMVTADQQSVPGLEVDVPVPAPATAPAPAQASLPIGESGDLVAVLLDHLRLNPFLAPILDDLPSLGPPDLCLCAGAVCQTVWNNLAGRDPRQSLVDIDLIYFDPDLSAESEAAVAARLRERYHSFGMRIDVKNQARVHLWYGSRFGLEIAPFTSLADAVASFPTSTSSVGVMQGADGLMVLAPLGLADIFNRVVRPNRRIITAEIYAIKTDRWRRDWPELTVEPWTAVTD